MTHLPPQTPAPLPPLAFWKARSFWLTTAALVTTASMGFGVDLPGVLGFPNDSELGEAVFNTVSAVTVVLAWRERLDPRRRLTLGK